MKVAAVKILFLMLALAFLLLFVHSFHPGLFWTLGVGLMFGVAMSRISELFL